MTVPDILIAYEGNPRFDAKTAPRIDAIANLRPLLDSANATTDETILLHTAEECEKAGLKILAESYRCRAGCGKKSDRQIKLELAQKALQYITTREKGQPVEIQHFLGINRHKWFAVATQLRKSGKVEFVNNKFYILRQEYWLRYVQNLAR